MLPTPHSELRTADAEARELKILNERLWHFTSVGLGNCQAAQRVRREIECQVALQNAATIQLDPGHRQCSRDASNAMPPRQALLANANFDADEPRDWRGRWTTKENADASRMNSPEQTNAITQLTIGAPASGHGATTTNDPNQYLRNVSDSLGATINAAPIKFGLGFEQGLQQVASDIGQGFAQLSDPGPLPDNFHTFLRAQDQALKIVPNPHFNPATGQWTVADPFARAMYQMDQQREAQREQMRAPGEAFSQAAGELAGELGALKDALPGPKIIGTAGEKSAEVAGYMAPSAIPYFGWATGAVAAGLGSTGDTFNRAFEIYRLAGYPEGQARDMARDVALRNGTLTALIFALPVGRLAALPESALGRILTAAGISGTLLSADRLQTLLHAKASYDPKLTLGDIARQTGETWLYGAVFGAATHGAAEASKVRGKAGAQSAEGKTAPELTSTDQQKKVTQDEQQENNRPVQGTARTDGTAAADAAAYVERGGDTTPRLQSGPSEIQRQGQRLQEWARQRGRLIDFVPPAGTQLSGGGEHEGFFDPAGNRFYKRTYPGTFGLMPADYWLERATPSFYLRRVDLMNQVFGSDIRVEGVTPGDKPSIITSQPFHKAADPLNPHPSEKEIADFMHSQGFEPHPSFDYGWVRKKDGITALDAKPDNFIKTKEGVVPIDLILQEESSTLPEK